MTGERAVRVLCWSERTERAEVYPQGINGAVAAALQEAGGFEVQCSNLGDDGQGLSEELVGWADVLVWFGHLKHRDVQQDGVAAIPKASSERHLRANFEVFDFALDAGDLREIAALATS